MIQVRKIAHQGMFFFFMVSLGIILASSAGANDFGNVKRILEKTKDGKPPVRRRPSNASKLTGPCADPKKRLDPNLNCPPLDDSSASSDGAVAGTGRSRGETEADRMERSYQDANKLNRGLPASMLDRTSDPGLIQREGSATKVQD